MSGRHSGAALYYIVLRSHVTDYYTRRLRFTEFGGEQEAADLHENFQPSREGEGEFSPDLYSR